MSKKDSRAGVRWSGQAYVHPVSGLHPSQHPASHHTFGAPQVELQRFPELASVKQFIRQHPTAVPGLLQQYCPAGQATLSYAGHTQLPAMQNVPPLFEGQLPMGHPQAPPTHCPPSEHIRPHLPQLNSSS